MFPLLRSLLLVLCLLPILAQAQLPIEQARQQPIGTVVTVSGIVTNGPEFGSIRYMQDGTAGIAVFPGTGSISGFSPAPGTNITVTGTLKDFNGLLEIDPVQSFTVNATGLPLPSPIVITPEDLGETYESQLVRVNDAQFSNAGASFTSTTWTFSSNGQTAVVYVRNSNPLIGTVIPFGQVDITGIVSQFSTSDPPAGGYQLLPRGPNDLNSGGGIAITSAVGQTDILPNGFTLHWTTSSAGTSGVFYGTDASLGQQVTSGAFSTDHVVVIDGMEPATFYHAQAWTVAGSDTAFSPVGLYSTASAVPGEVKVYFNQPVDGTVATGPLAIDLGSAIDDTIRAYIDRAIATIDVAVYNTSNNSIVHALNDAVDRGVQVRYIAEGSTGNSSLVSLPLFPVHYRMNSSGSGMHNKFLVIDAADPEHAFTITGSMNFTNFSFFFDANNVVVVKDHALAKAYQLEFEEMWGSSGPQPAAANSRFGADKQDNTPHFFNVNGTLIESRFSPSDATTARIRNAVTSADHHIEFALFALTHDDLINDLIDMNALPEVTVRGILNDDENSTTSFQQLVAGGVDVLLDNVEGSNLHHKYAIVDRHESGSDPLVITGSHNWSYNAETHNDENTLIIHSAGIADQFYQEWAARWTTAVGIAEGAGELAGLQLWPNPAEERCTISFHSIAGGEMKIMLIDATGRIVQQTSAVTAPGPFSTVVAVGDLAPGAYLISVEQNGQQGRHALIRR